MQKNSYLQSFVLVIIILLIFIIPAAAQDEEQALPEPECTAPELGDLMLNFAEMLASAESAIAEEDAASALQNLRALHDGIQTAQLECTGMNFTSAQLGQQPVIGPVMIPSGAYRVTAVSEDDFSVAVEALSGECEITGATTRLFNLSNEEGAGGVERIFVSRDCLMLMAAEGADDWEFSFEFLAAVDE